MAILKCKMCGGTLSVTENQTICECEYCGTKQTLPRLNDERLLNMYDRASWLRRNNEFDKASVIYEQILSENKEDAEAYWSLVLCKYGVEYVEDPATGNRIPTVNRTQFDSIFNDTNYKEALSHATEEQKQIYELEANRIDEIQKGILSISNNEEPYDIFICYKETDERGNRTIDSVLAQDIYNQLTKEGYKAFFSRITLEDKIGQAYEPYIFAALNSAKVMIVVGTNKNNLEAVWVKNEWSRYLSMIKNGESKILIPAYRDMSPYDLPDEFAYLQAQDMSKLGFMQDLIRGIDKIVGKNIRRVTHETANTVQSSSTNVTALLKRANMFLNEKDFKSADEYFERVLDNDPENSEAMLGKFFIENKVSNEAEFATKLVKEVANKNIEFYEVRKIYKFSVEELGIQKLIEKYYIPNYFKKNDILTIFYREKTNSEENNNLLYNEIEYTGYKSVSRENFYILNNRVSEEISNLENNTFISRIMKYGDKEVVVQLENEIKKQLDYYNEKFQNAIKETETNLNNAKKEFEKVLSNAENKIAEEYKFQFNKRDKDYLDVVNSIDSKKKVSLTKQLKILESFNGYKESKRYIDECKKRLKKENTKLTIAATCLLLLLSIVGFVGQSLYKIKLYNSTSEYYNSANEYYNNNNYKEAAIAYGKLGNYQDSYEKAKLCWDKIADRKTLSSSNISIIGIRNDDLIVSNNTYSDLSEWNNIIDVSTANRYAVGLKSDGTVVSSAGKSNSLTDISRWNNVVTISVGSQYQVLGLKSDGTVVATSSNPNFKSYTRSINTWWSNIVAISAGPDHSLGLKSDGTVVAVGSNTHGSCNVNSWSDIIAISAGTDYSLGLKSDGTVVCTNRDALVFDFDGWNNIIAISAGPYHSLGLKSDGTVVATGNNNHNQCDVSEWTDIVDVVACSTFSLGLKSDGTIVSAGANLDYIQSAIDNWSDIKVNK